MIARISRLRTSSENPLGTDLKRRAICSNLSKGASSSESSPCDASAGKAWPSGHAGFEHHMTACATHAPDACGVAHRGPDAFRAASASARYTYHIISFRRLVYQAAGRGRTRSEAVGAICVSLAVAVRNS